MEWSDGNRERVLQSEGQGAQRMEQTLERLWRQSSRHLVRRREYRMTTRGVFWEAGG